MRQVSVALPPELASIRESVVKPMNVKQPNPFARVDCSGMRGAGTSKWQLTELDPLPLTIATESVVQMTGPIPPVAVGTNPPHGPSFETVAPPDWAATGCVAIVKANATAIRNVTRIASSNVKRSTAKHYTPAAIKGVNYTFI